MSLENLVYKITPGLLNQKAFGQDFVPTSKSQCNRALILAAIKGEMKISPLAKSTDTENLLNAFKDLGIKFSLNKNEIHVKNSFYSVDRKKKRVSPLRINAHDGGTTSRFLMALLATGENPYFLILSKEMLLRPMDELVDALNSLGAKISKYTEAEHSGFLIQGPLEKLITTEPVKIEIDSLRSSQFYTALKLLTLKFANLTVSAKNLENSKTYTLMTDEILKRAQTGDHLDIPYDFSSLSYLVAFMAVSSGGVISEVTKLDSEQADSALIEILKNAGVQISLNAGGLKIEGAREHLTSLTADASLYPDLIPTLVFLAAHIEGESKFCNLQILEHKESNRVKELVFLLELFEVPHRYDPKNYRLFVQGSKSKVYRAIDYFPPNDHRLIMTAGLFMRLNYGGLIYKAQHVKKSFPDFFEFLAD